MGMPIGIDVRDPTASTSSRRSPGCARSTPTFSTYRDDSDISRLDRGEIALADCRARGRRGAHALHGARARDARLLLRPRRRPARPVRPRQGLGGRRRGRPARRGGRRAASASTPAATSSPAAAPRPAARGGSASAIPSDLERLAAVLAVEDLAVATSGRVRARRAHRRSRTRAARRPACSRSPSSARTSRRPTPTPPPRSPWARTGRPGRRRSTGYDAMCITTDRRVLQTPGFARHRSS